MSLATRQQLRKYLKQLGAGEETPDNTYGGICGAIEYSLDRKTFGAVKQLMTKWPEFSGDDLYPVAHPDMPPMAAYYGVIDLWEDNEYGQARRRLCTWLSEQL